MPQILPFRTVNFFVILALATALIPITDRTTAKRPGRKQTQNIPRPRQNKLRHFVFGYGSLICPESRKETNPSLGKKHGLPVVVQNVQRGFSARTKNGYTAMGVSADQGATCTGVVIEVNESELPDLDRREANYNRKLIPLQDIDPLQQPEERTPDHPVLQAKRDNDNSDNPENVMVWVYIQKNPIPADPSHPIPQTYVDVMLRGCLHVGGEEYARSFIETTVGWHSHDTDGDTHGAAQNEGYWVNDRSDPMYVRADKEFSESHGESIDRLLQKEEPNAFEHRVQYDPGQHLEALEEALSQGLANPIAIKRTELRVNETNVF